MVSRQRGVFRIGSGLLVISLVVAISCAMSVAIAQEAEMNRQDANGDTAILRLATAQALKALPEAQAGTLIETLGFHEAGDGGAALYRVQLLPEDLEPNDADVIALPNGLVAVLLENRAVNYRMFGAVGDGENDDGVQIKLAHEYANRVGIPVVNLGGEFWINETNNITIQTNVSWGNTIFYIDERHNVQGTPRFVVASDEPTVSIELDDELKQALLEKIRPGVQIIPELAPWANHLVIVRDDEDRIGFRAGYENHRGWAREEFFYVEEEGRILGDIAWEFTDFTSVRATPCNDSYLIIEGGGFRMSGHNPETGSTGYHHNGFVIRRSRTIVRDQWMGLQQGRRDESLAARQGFYTLSGVYDVTLENIRLMPWEKTRRDPEPVVPHGTYGIGGSRMLNCTFRNLTAEAGWVSWGVFGTNLTKNMRIENSQLNRVDVHFHAHNLYIKDSTIGFKGITVTGAGDLFIENTTRHGNNFIGFRRDYGSTWDGRIRLRGCTLKPTSNSAVTVLSYRPADFEYGHEIGIGRDITIEDLVVDYSAAPASEAPCWLMGIANFSRTSDGGRLFFPAQTVFRNIRVEGREQGVRLLAVPDPYHFQMVRSGGYDGERLVPNSRILVENVQLERLNAQRPGDTANVHLLIGGGEPTEYSDEYALYPRIRFADCDDVSVHVQNAAASLYFDRCSLNTVSAVGLQGDVAFNDCSFQARLAEAEGEIYPLESTLGARFTNSTIHAPVVGGEARPELVDQLGLLEINGTVRHSHLNTTLGNRILEHLREEGITLTPEFISRLRLNHPLDQ